MRKSSRSVSLALIGSALWVGGCAPTADENEWTAGDPGGADGIAPTANEQGYATANDQYNGRHGEPGGRTASRIGGAVIGSQIGRALGGGGSAPGYAGRPGGYGGGAPGYGGGGMSGPSARGGFGSSAGHSSAS